MLFISPTRSFLSEVYLHHVRVDVLVQHNVFNQATNSRVISPHDEE